MARPSRVRFVQLLPKTRSGKLLRRAIQAVCEQRDPGDLITLDDPAALPPRMHIWNSSRIPWLVVNDDLPRHAEIPEGI